MIPLLLALMSATPPPPPPAEPSFEQRYPNPVIDSSVDTGVPGLQLIWVYDRSEQAMDPLTSKPWFSAAGKKFRATEEGLAEALAHLKFDPKSKEEAIGAATAIFRAHTRGENSIVPNDQLTPVIAGLPEPARKAVHPPTANKLGDHWRVVFFVFESGRVPSGRQRESRPARLFRVVAEVGKGVLRTPEEQIWLDPNYKDPNERRQRDGTAPPSP